MTIFIFSFLYHKPQLCSNVMQIMAHLHLANDSWNLKILKLHFEFLKISSTTNFNYECFSYVNNRLSSFQKKSHQNSFIKNVLTVVFYKTDIGVLKFKNHLLNPKLNLVKYFHFIF
jgi:hypothetical protein